MRSYIFEPEYASSLFINEAGGITLLQSDGSGPDSVVVFSSKTRAVEVARAILELAKVATFKPEEKE